MWVEPVRGNSGGRSWICEAYGAVYTGSPPGLPRQAAVCAFFSFFFFLSLSLSRALVRNVNREPWSSLPAKGEMGAALMQRGCQKRVRS